MLAMFKRFIHSIALYLKGETRTREKLQGSRISSVDLSSQQKDLSVRIVHAGGLVELYQDAVPAFEVMEKYPGMHLSRPEIFKRPHESILHPYEKLLPGQKFYLVPSSTVLKLKRKHSKKSQNLSSYEGLEETLIRKKTLKEDRDHFEVSFCSARDFFASRCALWKCEREMKKPFTPPIKLPRMLKGLEWHPSLPSVEEVSP